jgi:hypothetical protein
MDIPAAGCTPSFVRTCRPPSPARSTTPRSTVSTSARVAPAHSPTT